MGLMAEFSHRLRADLMQVRPKRCVTPNWSPGTVV
jgi:hypothetical protein